ncbi:MAG: TatD family hydrolase [Flavobacteriales bacterium]
MQLIDSHNHLYKEEFDEDRDEVVKKAFNEGIDTFVLPNIDSRYIKRMNTLKENYPDNCRPMMGLHPVSVGENYLDELDIIEKELDKGGYCAIGEIGLDLYWDKTYWKEQEKAFRRQIDWAKEKELPFVIHVRNAFEETLSIVEEMNTPELRGVFHCFTGDHTLSERIMNLGGFYMGIGGIVTFKNAGLDKVVKDIPLKYLLLETDAPYLAPHPFRGKRNEPSYMRKVAEKIAEVKNTYLSTVAEITSNNCRDIFKFD